MFEKIKKRLTDRRARINTEKKQLAELIAEAEHFFVPAFDGPLPSTELTDAINSGRYDFVPIATSFDSTEDKKPLYLRHTDKPLEKSVATAVSKAKQLGANSLFVVSKDNIIPTHDGDYLKDSFAFVFGYAPVPKGQGKLPISIIPNALSKPKSFTLLTIESYSTGNNIYVGSFENAMNKGLQEILTKAANEGFNAVSNIVINPLLNPHSADAHVKISAYGLTF